MHLKHSALLKLLEKNNLQYKNTIIFPQQRKRNVVKNLKEIL